MIALYRTGRQAEALGAYQRLRVALSDELGLDPSPAIEQLQQRILNQDPSLDLGGEPLRGYRLIEQIGSGPLGLVHRALEPQTERDVAIKVIGPRLANDGEFIRRFDPEAGRVFRLEHPHIVPLYDWWREPDAAYLVMRLMRGGSLEERLRDGPILPDDAMAWSEQIGSGLAAVHRQGIFHGDIRAGNVLFDEDGNAYLSDVTIGHDAVLRTSRHRATTSSPYLAPERAAGGPPSASADVYALATLLGEVLREVELGSGATELLAIFERARSPLPNVRPESAGELVAAVRKAILSPALAPVEIDLPAGPARNPYKGLRPFEEADAADFVGREGLIDELVGRLAEPGEAARLLAVVGPSGSGKSSVVSAGLVPALRGGAIPGSERWLIISMTPGQRPFDQLERQLLGVAVSTPAALGELLEAAEGFRPVIERVLPESAELLIIIDQFEELFSLTDEPTRDRFLSAIARTHRR